MEALELVIQVGWHGLTQFIKTPTIESLMAKILYHIYLQWTSDLDIAQEKSFTKDQIIKFAMKVEKIQVAQTNINYQIML